MAPKTAHQAAKKKAAKEKKILILLLVPAAAAGFFAYHTVSKLHHNANLPLATAPATTTPGSSPTAAPAGVAAAPIALSVASGGKLTSLAGLKSRDPFHNAGPQTTTTATSSSSGTPSSGTSGSKSKKQQAGTKTPLAPPTAAVISVNGKLRAVSLHSTFGHARGFADQPLFKLVAVTQKTATIAIVGSPHQRYTLKLHRGRVFKDTLGNLYRLKLLPPGTPVPTSATSTTETTTTPTTPTFSG